MRKINLIAALAFALTACSPIDTAVSTEPVMSFGDDHTWVTLSSGNNNNIVVNHGGRGIYTFVPDAAGSTVTGLSTANGVYAGDGFWMRNGSTTTPIVLSHADTASSAGNRFELPYETDFALAPEHEVWIHLWSHDEEILGWTIALEGVYGVSSMATPSHTLGTTWQNTTNRPVLGLYSVRVDSTMSLMGGAAGRVELAIGATSGSQPTLCGRVAGGNTGATATGVDTVEGQLSCAIPPNWWGILRTTNEVGTPTYTITNQLEQAL